MPDEIEVQPLETVTPTEQATPPAENSTESGTGQPAEHADGQPPQEQPKNDWVQRRIDQLTREKHEERRQREALEARLRNLQPPETPSFDQSGRPLDVHKAAEQLLKQRDFDAACNKTYEAGKAEFPDFDKALQTFGLLGGASPEFLEAVTALESGHRVIQHLGSHPETAERVLSLPPVRMAFELARLDAEVGKPKAAPQSKAPPPISPVGGKAAPVEPSEFKSPAEYIAWRKANRK